MDRLISLQAAIDAADMADYPGLSIEDVDKVTGEVVKALKELPSAQPEPKRGEWTPIHKGERGFSAGDFRCSVCHQPNKCYTITNYCSHCGAYMKSMETNDQ